MKSRIPPLGWILFVLLCIVCLVVFPGCATSTRVSITTPERTVNIVFPKNFSAKTIDFDLDPRTGEIRFRGTEVHSDASKVIDSTAGAVGHVTDAAKSIAPLVK